jgi:hypothetical protein
LAPSFPPLYIVWSQQLSDLSLARLYVTCSQLYEQAQPYEVVKLYEVLMFLPQQPLLLACVKFWESLYVKLALYILSFYAQQVCVILFSKFYAKVYVTL